MSWNIKTPGDYINGPLTVAGLTQFNSNVGIGTAPSGWGGNGFLNLPSNTAVSFKGTQGSVVSNAYYDTQWRYYGNGLATQYFQNNGAHTWFTAPNNTSGAGAALTFTQGMTLDATGLGLGTTPTQRLTVSGNISLTNSAATSLGLTNATSGITYTLFSASPAGNGFTGFGIYDGSAYIMRTNQQGDFGVGVLPDNTKSACLQLKSGVSFPAAQVTSTDANTLDDYEEGTFTPTINGTTVVGTATYNGRSGRYTKIGNQVHVQIFIDWTGHTGTGDMRIAGLPFQNGGNFSAASIGYSNAVASTAGYVVSGYVEASQSYIQMSQFPVGGGTATTLLMDAAGVLVVNASYQI